MRGLRFVIAIFNRWKQIWYTTGRPSKRWFYIFLATIEPGSNDGPSCPN
jgi:hypothetical protein